MLSATLRRRAGNGAAKRLVAGLLRGVSIVALVALAAVLAAFALPRAFGDSTLVVNGGSMGSSIPKGSLVVARWMAADQVRVGDVILVKEQNAEPKLHRVVSIEKDGSQVLARTKGDANATEDPNLYVLPDRVLTPVYHIPYVGFLVAFISTRLGWALLIGIPGVLLCLAALRSIWSPGRKPPGEEELSA